VIQSIRLLQLGNHELEDFLREQADDNPLLTVVVGPSHVQKPDSSACTPAQDRGGSPGGTPRLLSHVAADMPGPGQYLEARVSLRDHLIAQISLIVEAPVDQLIAGDIVDSLDPDGYFRRDPEEMAELMGIPVSRVQTALKAVQECEPTGVAARDLPECLSLQLAERGGLTEPMRALLENLDLLGDYKIEPLARICGLDVKGVMDLVRRIRELDPRPGRRFDTDPVVLALPDIYVEMADDGRLTVELNASVMPRVLIDRDYAEVSAGIDGKTDQRFMIDSMSNANWLARSIDQRARTILRVATEIVARQNDFFRYGAGCLKPLSLKDIAAEVDLHESTVCRAVADKYMMTPRGMFELKFFFANSVSVTDGDSCLSVDTVRHRLRQLIDAETPTSILSDQAIMDTLRSEGIDIARRTVAKYREMMDIPTSRKRKRLKAPHLAGACAMAQAD
jgi:RNA polymerase sigma-54 factor